MSAANQLGWVDHARTELRRAGARSGGARDTVIEYLATQDCCLSAQELFDGLRAEGRKVGIASVYRALDELAQLRLVHRVELGHGVSRFEAARLEGRTVEFRVEAFDDKVLEQAVDRVAGTYDYALNAHEVVLHGACGDCRK